MTLFPQRSFPPWDPSVCVKGIIRLRLMALVGYCHPCTCRRRSLLQTFYPDSEEAETQSWRRSRVCSPALGLSVCGLIASFRIFFKKFIQNAAALRGRSRHCGQRETEGIGPRAFPLLFPDDY